MLLDSAGDDVSSEQTILLRRGHDRKARRYRPQNRLLKREIGHFPYALYTTSFETLTLGVKAETLENVIHAVRSYQ